MDDPEEVHGSLVRVGFEPTPVVVTPWGTREFAVADPSGNLIRLGSPS